MKRAVVVGLLLVLVVAPGSLSAKVNSRKTTEQSFVRQPCITLLGGPCSVQPLSNEKSTADVLDKTHRRH